MFGLKRNNHKSVFVEVLVLIVVIVFCALTVIYIVRANDLRINTSSTVSKTKTISKTSIPNDTPPQGEPPVNISSSTSTNKQTTQQSNETTIDIKPVGISITLPSSMSDLTYNATSSDGSVTVNFSTATITNEISSCSAASGQGAFDRIIRADGQYPSSSNPNEGLIKQEPTYYIAYLLPNGPCANNLSPDLESLLDQDSQSFYSALSTIQVIN